ncbi:MAG TPA: superoxide dismutase family protein [Opitutaceae bacterium]|nr:superoxide dismutase family protein [Opitutaceae bacterium]
MKPYLASALRWIAAAAALAAAGLARADSAVTSAIAVISPTAGHSVSGTVKFSQTAAGVRVVADLSGLPPGKHGFHIHEYGDISDAAGAMKTGGHYDPAGTHHHQLVEGESVDAAAGHHAGDLGNVTADDSGQAHLELTLAGVSLTGPSNAIVGRAVIIHEKADDGGQPTGNAGGRLGQGVIGIAK